MTNSLMQAQVQQYAGQSIWLDGPRPRRLDSDELRAMVCRDEVTGISVTYDGLRHIIASATDLETSIRSRIFESKDPIAICEHLLIDQARRAADLLRQVYERTRGLEGYTSIEVSPYVVDSAEELVKRGRELFLAVGRKNVMIRLPATTAGLVALEQLVSTGVNVFVSDILTEAAYLQAAEAYSLAVDKYLRRGGNALDVIALVAMPLSKIDRIATRALESSAQKAGPEQSVFFDRLKGRAATTFARLAYRTYRSYIADGGNKNWKVLAGKGARPLRIVLECAIPAPHLPASLYLEELSLPETIVSLPETAILALCRTPAKQMEQSEDHVDEVIDQAILVYEQFKQLPFSISDALEDELSFLVDQQMEVMDQLIGALEQRRRAVELNVATNLTHSLGELESPVKEALAKAKEDNVVARLWRGDTTLWTGKDEGAWLGWLDIPEQQLAQTSVFQELSGEVRREKFTHAVLLGMGGSSLSAEVMRQCFGKQEGMPELLVLDSTVPAEVLKVRRAIEIEKTIFIVSSKSGSTTEPNVLCQYFYEETKKAVGDKEAGSHFIAVTDPGSSLEQTAKEMRFRHIYPGVPSIGGRYSVLSHFGMIPGAVMGADVKKMLERAHQMALRCHETVASNENPGLLLGVIMAVLSEHGRDKVTLFASPRIRSFGTWLEQLLAESTGKLGKGIIPVDGESIASPEHYGKDRLFVYLRLSREADKQQDKQVEDLKRAGHPVVNIELDDAFGIAEEFFRWEFATAVAGHVLKINPFDQPNVQESKDFTKKFLKHYEETGKLPEDQLVCRDGDITIYADDKNKRYLLEKAKENLEAVLKAHIARLQPGDYFATTAYVEYDERYERAISAIRDHVRDDRRVATTFGYGPRFLHSTGQLHKGGPNSGLFIQITCDDKEDVPVPAEKFTFGVLKQAQSLGDFVALSMRDRRALRVHFSGDIARGLSKLQSLLS